MGEDSTPKTTIPDFRDNDVYGGTGRAIYNLNSYFNALCAPNEIRTRVPGLKS
jgi:hypothetical protein